MTVDFNSFINCGHPSMSMYIEKRESGENIKYYLSHTFRDENKYKKIRKYLGQNISSKELEKLSKEAEKWLNEMA